MKRTILALLTALVFALPAFAQEATEPAPAEATQAAPLTDTEITVEDGGTVNIDAPETNNIPTLINLVIVIIAAIVGGGSFAVIWGRIRTSVEAKNNTERLFEGLSPTWQTTILKVLDVAEQVNKTAGEVLQFARESTDKLPNTTPPEPPSSMSTPHR